MQAFWIIGFGRVGRRALERLQGRAAKAAITVVDPRYARPPETLPPGVAWEGDDGVSFLVRRLSGREEPSTWIIPALPRHLAYEWLAARLRAEGEFEPRPVPGAVAMDLPNPVRGPEGQVYISIADFICPDNCSEPAQRCPATGAPRPFDLHAHLAGLHHEPYRSLVVRSHQLAHGLGGYRARRLIEALDTVHAHPGAYLVSTASKCHGVVHAFGYDKQDSRVPGAKGSRVNNKKGEERGKG